MKKIKKTKTKITKKELKKIEKRARNKADKQWSIIVKDMWGHKCAVCGGTEHLNSHHLIPREIAKFRHNPSNGICLCPTCHKFGRYSAHKHPLWFMAFIRSKNPGYFDCLLDAAMEEYDERITEEIRESD